MNYTKFGEILRVLRIKNHEVMGDTSKLLNVSAAFLSSVETGKKNVPEGWYDILVKHYNLGDKEKDELSQAIELSKTQMKINLSQADNYKREMALQFQRSFNEIDERTAEKIISLLNKKGD